MAEILFPPTPVTVSSVPDDCLGEGRKCVPFVVDFVRPDNQTPVKIQVNFSSLAGQQQLSAVKGLFVAMDESPDDNNDNLLLKLTVEETQQVYLLGLDFPSTNDTTLFFQLPLLAVAVPTITIEVILGGVSATGDHFIGRFHFTNFEVEPFTYSAGVAGVI